MSHLYPTRGDKLPVGPVMHGKGEVCMQMDRNLAKLSLAALAPLLLMAPWAGAAHSDHGCDSCHTPHNAGSLPGVPLWNGNETITTFTMYSSTTLQASIDGQPSGA